MIKISFYFQGILFVAVCKNKHEEKGMLVQLTCHTNLSENGSFLKHLVKSREMFHFFTINIDQLTNFTFHLPILIFYDSVHFGIIQKTMNRAKSFEHSLIPKLFFTRADIVV